MFLVDDVILAKLFQSDYPSRLFKEDVCLSPNEEYLEDFVAKSVKKILESDENEWLSKKEKINIQTKNTMEWENKKK